MRTNSHSEFPVTRADAINAGRDRAQRDAATRFMKIAGRQLARRMYKTAAEGDMGAILTGAIANRFGPRPALQELAETEDSRREPSVTDPQENLPQLAAGRAINAGPLTGQLLPLGQVGEAGGARDSEQQQYGRSRMTEQGKLAAWNPLANFIQPIARDVMAGGRAVVQRVLKPAAQDVAAAGRNVAGRLRPRPGPAALVSAPAGQQMAEQAAHSQKAIGQLRAPKSAITPPGQLATAEQMGSLQPLPVTSGRVTPVGQLATPQQAAQFQPLPAPVPAPALAGQLPAAPAAQQVASAAPGHLAPAAGVAPAPGGAQAATQAPEQLSRKANKATEIEGVRGAAQPAAKKGHLVRNMLGAGAAVGTIYAGAKGIPALAGAAQNATANPMAYGMGYSNLPLGYGQQEYTNF